jgi:1,4-dihydroxy-2-naphthoate polyprenyltransferase
VSGKPCAQRAAGERSPGARPPLPQVWLAALRPRTLVASLVPVAVGSALASAEGALQPLVALVCAFAALALQIATNLANDAFDFMHQIDSAARLGPVRVTQAGWLTPRQVLAATGVALGVAAVAGLYLVSIGGLPIFAIGVASMLGALAYSAGPWPLASLGLGEVSAFLFFGVIAVTGTHYLHTGAFSAAAFGTSIPVAALVALIMAVNNLRDVDTDRAAGKRTLAVRIGAQAARQLCIGLVALAFAWTLGLGLVRAAPGALLPWLALPLALFLLRDVQRAQAGIEFNQALAGAARLHAVYGMLFALGLAL